MNFDKMPHEVLVIANQSSEDSLEVLIIFDKRQIPKNNLIKVEIPELYIAVELAVIQVF